MLRVCVVADLTSSYGRNLFQGVGRYSRGFGPWSLQYRVTLEPARLGPDRFDGAIAQVADAAAREMMRAVRIPVVNVSAGLAESEQPQVICDDRQAGRMAAEHLLDRGFKHFAYLGQPARHFSAGRGEGFAAAVRAAGYACAVTPDDAPMVPSGACGPHATNTLPEWVAALPKPVGLFACHDLRARHVALVCRELGLLVPDEVSLVGVDNDEIECELSGMPLSSVDVAAERIGFEAAQTLAAMMDGRGTHPQAIVRVPPTGVVTRHSSDVLAIEDRDVAVAVRFIRDHSGDVIHVDDVLTAVPLSRRALEQRFRRHVGRSIGEEIRRAHVERAKRLLAESDLPMSAVAKASGFNEQFYLSTSFRRQTGMTPRSYREQFRSR